MACRSPGGPDNTDAFWEFLVKGKDAIEVVPKERWDIDQYYSPDRLETGKMYTRHGSFIKNVDLFDAEFFSILPL